jgi:L-serine dehydratase
MTVSLFELFKIGIGPSASHTVGPMCAAHQFISELEPDLMRCHRIEVRLMGSLAWTGKGHATDKAILWGLMGFLPATLDLNIAQERIADVQKTEALCLNNQKTISFHTERDLIFDYITTPPQHPNTFIIKAFDTQGETLLNQTWCSIGGGFIVRGDGHDASRISPNAAHIPYPFSTGKELLQQATDAKCSIAEIIFRNECTHHTPDEVHAYLDRIADTMMACVNRGLETEGELPGGLHVQRRAKSIYAALQKDSRTQSPHEIMDYISAFAIAVNEENAAGGRVVTAPTNGAAGVVPGVLRYYRDFCYPTQNDSKSLTEQSRIFLLTATAIGILCKMNASISGAEVGCQGEVGSASSMAAAGLTAALGGTNAQIENAAEIAMEHHLGMTCDPIAGLVQIPCIERNAFGAIKAVNAASLALHGDGSHRVSLDHAIETMRRTGADMQAQYKETSLGGLAVNFIEC